MGASSQLVATSVKGIQETSRQIPNKIDRDSFIPKTTFGRDFFIHSGFGMTTTAVHKHTRETIGKTLQLNKASQYIPLILNVTKEYAKKNWKVGKNIEFLNESIGLIFEIVTRIVFGEDIDLEKTYPFIHRDGSIEQKTFPRFFYKLGTEGVEEGFKPLS